MLAGQVNHVVGEIQGDFIEREVGIVDLLRQDGVAVAVAACQRCGLVGTYNQLPDLEFRRSHALVIGLNDGDFIEEARG